MKIFYSPASPFVRKCMIVAIEHGLDAQIERLVAAPSVTNRVPALEAANPLRKLPVLQTDDGSWLFDSRVICEYLDTLGGGTLIPPLGTQRWRVLTLQSLADGILDAAVVLRYELALRPQALQWDGWVEGQTGKITGALDLLESQAADFSGAFDLGQIGVVCALGYLDFRHPNIGWRTDRGALAAWYEQMMLRDSVRQTAPAA